MDYNKLRNIIYEYSSTFFDENPIIIHAGSHHGEICVDILSKIFPTSTIHTFEPFEESFQICSNKIIEQSVSNVKIYKIGLSNKSSDKSEMNLCYHTNTNSLFKVNEEFKYCTNEQSDDTINIELTTLDLFCGKNNITNVDFLHLNVEGSELDTLIGAKKIMENIKVVFLEVNLIEIWKDCPLFWDIDKYMMENNFYLSMHDQRKYYEWTNIQHGVLYINKKFYPKF